MKRLGISYILLLLFLCLSVFIAGCNSYSPSMNSPLPQPDLRANLMDSSTSSHGFFSSTGDMSFSGQVFNQGSGTANNVMVEYTLREGSSNGPVVDTKREYIGTIRPGESRPISVVFKVKRGVTYYGSARPYIGS